MLLLVGLLVARLLTAAGAVVSAGAVVVPLGLLEMAEVLGTSSVVLMAK